jgi:hypothetical protein
MQTRLKQLNFKDRVAYTILRCAYKALVIVYLGIYLTKDITV